MVTEIAILQVKEGQCEEFETNFCKAQSIISSIAGYIEHELQKCLEAENKYLLVVRWETLESHTINFRQSSGYKEWKQLLHHFYDPFPVVEHYQTIF